MKLHVTIDCPHCQKQVINLPLDYVGPDIPIRKSCPLCGEPLWVRVAELLPDGQARLQIGTTVTPSEITELLKEHGGKCPTCGREVKPEANQMRSYLIPEDAGIVRQGKVLPPHGVAKMIRRLCESGTIPAVWKSRLDLEDDGIVVQLWWNDIAAANKGLEIFGVKLEEVPNE